MKIVFIVPYRKRHQHKFFFVKHMKFLLEDMDSSQYEILFIHQCDERNFNRGAMKNIGFLVCKERYPETYKDITFVFHDIDTLPFHKLFDYETRSGIVKHYYGFQTALGGIFAIKGIDFEKTRGFPNYWGWGMEDACLQKRCLMHGIQINRDTFYEIGHPNMLQFFDGVNRLVSKRDCQRMKTDTGSDGFHTIHRLSYQIKNDGQSMNPEDNIYTLNDSLGWAKIVNVTSFFTLNRVEREEYYNYDLRDPVSSIIFPSAKQKQQQQQQQQQQPSNWTTIPMHERTELLQQQSEYKPHLLQPKPQQPQPQPHQQQQHNQIRTYRKRRLLF
jgi:N-terminal region of glycosyl transferase group 7/N-terminal domain of galactosyltransferase